MHKKCLIKLDIKGELTESERFVCHNCQPKEVRGSTVNMPSSEDEGPETNSAISELLQEFKKLSNKFDTNLTLLGQVQTDVATVKETVSNLKSDVNKLDQKVHELQEDVKENEKLSTENASSIKEMQEEVTYNSDMVENLQEYNRRSCIEIHGIPKKENEDCYKIVLKLAEFLEVPMKMDNIYKAHRLPSRLNNPIIVKFVNGWACDHIKSARIGKKIISNDIGIEGNKEIYINVSLTKLQGNIAMQTRQYFKDKDCKVIVDDHAKIWVRKKYATAEEYKANKNKKFQINNISDIKKVHQHLLALK